MNNNEYSALITLITSQDQRLNNKIDSLQEEVANIHKQVKIANGRTRRNELGIALIKSDFKHRTETCYDKLEKLTPSVKTVKMINWVGAHWKAFLFLFLAGALVTNFFVIIFAKFFNIETLWQLIK